jgi:alkylation response protein AidB-like acyl-CoA dehydrogenase
MQIELAPADQRFRDDVRAFLAEKLTADLRAEAARQTGVFAEPALGGRWHRILYEKGWVAPSWPKEYGGPGWTQAQRHIFDRECALAGAPILPAMGLQMCGPVLMGCGTEEQKAYFLPRILSGEHYWCQGYSEPESGSDLASLKCRAERDGDDYVINGSKIWTTHAHFANWMFLLVRTSWEGKPQSGITFLLLDMSAPGLTIKPILSMSGEHEVNQCFFDNVRVPIANRVGAENEGWKVAKVLLEFERGGGGSARVRALLERVREMLRRETSDGAALSADDDFRRKIAALDCELAAAEWTERRLLSQISAGQNTGDASASMLKLAGSEIHQRVTELALEAIGHYGCPDQRAALAALSNTGPIGPEHALTPTARYLNARAGTIFGGSSEIQRNILARAALGL